MRCGCKPGNREDGWQEIRSKQCLDKELEVWNDLFRRMPEIIKSIREDS